MNRPKLHTVPSRLSAAPNRLSECGSTVSWRTGRTTAERGYGGRWQRYRVSYLQAHPLCVMCEAEGRVTAATVVDHIKPHDGDDGLFWEPTNHQALCKPHHDREKQREDATHRQQGHDPYAACHRPYGRGESKARNPQSS